jgi:hypothetical protein
MDPLPGALIRVYFHGTYEEDYSDDFGYYHVTNIPLCYCLKNATCSKLGYQSEWVMLSISENTTYNFILSPYNDTCYPVFAGIIGDNGIYVSCVNITFVAVGDVESIFYKIDGGSWTTYTEPFMICEDGVHVLSWYWIYQGYQSAVLCAPPFKIDRTPPEIQLSCQKQGMTRLKITAEATDVASGVNRVEFFLDGVLSYIDGTEPYEGSIHCIGIHHVKAVAYDNAGHSAESTLITPLKYEGPSFKLLVFLFQAIFVYKFLHSL